MIHYGSEWIGPIGPQKTSLRLAMANMWTVDGTCPIISPLEFSDSCKPVTGRTWMAYTWVHLK